MRYLFRCWLLLSIAVLPACAGSGSVEQAGPMGTAQIRIHNNLSQEVLTVTIAPTTGGVSHYLGEVGPNERRTLVYQHPGISGAYNLIAQAKVAGRLVRDLRSQSFTLAPGAAVQWELRDNRVTATDAVPR